MKVLCARCGLSPVYHGVFGGVGVCNNCGAEVVEVGVPLDTVVLGDCRNILPLLKPADVALLLTDPPYGIGYRTNGGQRSRGALTVSQDFPAIVGDDAPFDPTPLLRFPRLILFGANYYAERLPASASWLVWDKLDGLTSRRAVGFNDQADVEMAWTNLGGPARLVPHRWMGCMKDSERDERRVHPTQKPVRLMERIILQYTEPGDLVVDPYCGSGSTCVAAIHTGRHFLGIEIEPAYAAEAQRRVKRAQAQLHLFTAADLAPVQQQVGLFESAEEVS